MRAEIGFLALVLGVAVSIHAQVERSRSLREETRAAKRHLRLLKEWGQWQAVRDARARNQRKPPRVNDSDSPRKSER